MPLVAALLAAVALCLPAFGTPVSAETDPMLLLPNLVPGRPDFIGTELVGSPSFPIGVMVAGCNLDERVEQHARRCLRFTGIVENRGIGAFEVRWDATAQGGEQRARQRIFGSDGSFTDIDAGRFLFHPSHAHFHVKGILEQRLWASDESGTKTGAAPVRIGRKLGFCLADESQVTEDADPYRYGNECLAPSDGSQQVMGVSSGWNDIYLASTPGNFIEISGLPVGRYLLETVIDPDGLFIESDEFDNSRLDLIQLCGGALLPDPTDAREPC